METYNPEFKAENAPVPAVASIGMWMDVDKFEHAQRVAKLLALSTSGIVPKQFANKIGDCVIALNMAQRLGADPVALMQQMTVINGKPGFEGKFIKALLDNSGRFDPLDFDFFYDEVGLIIGCIASAVDRRTGKKKSIRLDWDTVKAEGWDRPKQGGPSKWLTHRQLMFIYRSASWFAKAYAPDLLLGMQSAEELAEMPTVVTPQKPRDASPEAIYGDISTEEV